MRSDLVSDTNGRRTVSISRGIPDLPKQVDRCLLRGDSRPSVCRIRILFPADLEAFFIPRGKMPESFALSTCF